MHNSWLIEHWWVLVVLVYVVGLALLMWILGRRGTLKTMWPKISLLTSCAIVALIPAMPSPASYFNAAIAVFNLLTLWWSRPQQKSRRPRIESRRPRIGDTKQGRQGRVPIADDGLESASGHRDDPLPRVAVGMAASVLAPWLDPLDPSHVDADEVLDIAVEAYSQGLGVTAHEMKVALRQNHSLLTRNRDLLDLLRWFWADPAQRDAVLTSDVLQSASLLLCIRLGLRRHEEFAAAWMAKTERNRRQRTAHSST